jgi:4-amino-4-deoxychorismate lyase
MPADTNTGMALTLVDGKPADSIPSDDRGLAYGDGVFRTMAVRAGKAPLWSRQYTKLAADCRALAITPPDETLLLEDLRHITAGMPDCALKITVTRGSGGRGYAMPGTVIPRRIVAASPLPDYPAEYVAQGVSVRYCRQRLAPQPSLAGVKHLNRLENVLARAEWHDPSIAEGLLLDTDGAVIEGTRCNLFLVERGNVLITPDLSRCGVAGVTRDAVIELAKKNGMACRLETVSRERLEAASEVLLVNSLISVWPVARIEARTWDRFETATRVRKWLHVLADPSV